MTLLKRMALFFLAPLSVMAATGQIKRSEDVGIVEGAVPEATPARLNQPEFFYNTSAEATARSYGFKARFALTIELADSSYAPCRRFSLDKNAPLDEFQAFYREYGGSKVRLTGVQRHYGVSGPMDCTFTDLEVLSSAEQPTRQNDVVKQRPEPGSTTVTSFGDVAVVVYTRRRDSIRTSRLLDSRPLSDAETRLWNGACRRIQVLSGIPADSPVAKNAEVVLENVTVASANGPCQADSVKLR